MRRWCIPFHDLSRRSDPILTDDDAPCPAYHPSPAAFYLTLTLALGHAASLDGLVARGWCRLGLSRAAEAADGMRESAIEPRAGADEPTVVCDGVCKSYGATRALRGVSLALRAGEVSSLLGPNGAGKSTLVRVLSASAAPDRGSVRVYGVDVGAQPAAARARLGLCLQGDDALFDALSVGEHLALYFGLKRRDADDGRAVRIPERERLLSMFRLRGRADAVVGALSGGQRRKLSVALALCGGSR